MSPIQCLRIGALLLCIAFQWLSGALSAAANQLYWTDSNLDRVSRASLAGTNAETVLSFAPTDSPQGIAFDLGRGHMYWSDSNRKEVFRANLDGTGLTSVISGLEAARAIALDTINEQVFFMADSANKIQSVGFDGSNLTTLVMDATLVQDSVGLALDLAGNRMYWTDSNLDKIFRANLDGTNPETVLMFQPADSPQGIALDLDHDHMYWTDSNRKEILRANLDGSEMISVISGLDAARAIALDVPNMDIYFTADSANKIQRVNFDGTGLATLFMDSTLVQDSVGLAIVPEPSSACLLMLSIGSMFFAMSIRAKSAQAGDVGRIAANT